jgi:hypothetical protein
MNIDLDVYLMLREETIVYKCIVYAIYSITTQNKWMFFFRKKIIRFNFYSIH